MKLFASRPLACACLLAMTAAVGGLFLPPLGRALLAFLLIALLLACVLLLIILGQRTRRAFSTALLYSALGVGLSLICLGSSIRYFDLAPRLPSQTVDSDTAAKVKLVVLEENSAGTGYAYYTVRMGTINGREVSYRATLNCAYTASFHVGDVIEADATVHSLKAYCEEEELLYAVADGIRYGLTCEDPASAVIVGTQPMKWRKCFLRWRAELSSRLASMTDKKSGGLVSALFLGERDHLDEGISAAFRRSGVSHLLALSGMHVTLLLGMAASLLSRTGLPKQGRICLLMVFAVFYLFLTGCRVSAIRAVSMILLLYLAELFGRRHDPLTTLSVAGYLMLTVSPATAVDGAFWMSFSSVFGLVAIMPKYNVWLKTKPAFAKYSKAITLIAASFVAVISVSFCTWIFNGTIAPIGILLTALLTPILSLILMLAPCALLLDILPFFSAVPLAFPLSVLLRFMTALTEQASRLPNSSFSLQIPYVGLCLGGMLIALLILLALPLRRKIWLAVPPFLALIAMISSTLIWQNIRYDGQIQASYVVRSSGSALVLSDRDEIAVIDTSAGNFSMMRDVEDAISEHSATEIQSLILTHYHRSYIYSIERLAKRQVLRRLYLPTPQSEQEVSYLSAMYARLLPLGTELFLYTEHEELPVLSHAVFMLADSSYLPRSSQPVITYLVQTSDEVLTYTTPSVQESPYYPTFRCISEKSDILLLGADGPRVKTKLELPFDSNRPRLILSDAAELLPYLDFSSSGPLMETEHYTDITCYHFTLSY